MQYAKEVLERAKEKLAQQVQRAPSLQDQGQLRSASSLGSSLQVTSTTPSSIQSLDARVARFKQELLGSAINLHSLGRLSYHGIPDRDNLRATVWKLLLGYLPPVPDQWAEALARRRTQYHVFCDELIVDPKREEQPLFQPDGMLLPPPEAITVPDDPLRAVDVTSADHPLCLSHTSRWNTYFKDSEIMVQVERDVMRTHPDMHFFTGDTPDAEAHREDLKRALFMYAKLNPGLRYIQGMNELIAPLYYLFKNDADRQAQQFAEADSFWCFMELISEFRDHFCQQLDNSQTGIRATIRRLMLLLQLHDKQLWHHVEIVHKVDPQFYAFRWITLLLSQEFSFPDVLRIWDTILSDPHGRMDCLLRICCVMILNVRDILMRGDFTVILKTLQRYPPVDVNVLLRRAAEMPPCKVFLSTAV